MVVPIAFIVISVLAIIVLMAVGQKISGDLKTVGVVICFIIGGLAIRQLYQGIIQREALYEQHKACRDRIEELNKAIETYNKDSIELMEKLDNKNLKKLSKKKLLKTNFFQDGDKKEFECTYSSKGNLNEGGEIECSVHGTYSNIKLEIIKHDN